MSAEFLFSATRREALERDGHACVRCGATADLQVGHIVPCRGAHDRRHGLHAVDNLQTLCRRCHAFKTLEENAERRAARTEARRLWHTANPCPTCGVPAGQRCRSILDREKSTPCSARVLPPRFWLTELERVLLADATLQATP